MTFSTIMAYVDAEPVADACLRAAVDLAEKFDARLIGISAANPSWSYYADSLPRELLEQLQVEIGRRLAQTEERFRRAAEKRVRQVEWRSEIASPLGYVQLQARAADLIVIGRDSIDPPSSPWVGRLNAGDLVMRAGRPVLIVPPKVEGVKLKCALVAWKDTREARRAVNDALPLLRKVKDVVVVEIIEDEAQRDSAHGRLDDVVAWLGHHGVVAAPRVFHFPESEKTRGKLWEYGADFIIAGAYGHARLREMIFGGFTLDLLKHSPQCAFLSH